MRVLQHPAQYWNWLLLFAAIIAGVIAIVIVIKKQLETTPSTD
jgi:hypothetical protein